MRRGVGIGGINQQLLEKVWRILLESIWLFDYFQAKFSEKGSELARDHLEKVD